ncbi:MAG: alpha/beta hydrolase [Aridibacter famidurans]|nr:alpha/beta hydrolase [Aridibacter famidurans]
MQLSGDQISRIMGLVAIFLIASTSYGQSERAMVPRFEKGPCAIKVPENIAFECGNLFVQENRAKMKSREIRLPVIIVKSTSENPEPDPVLYTAGGPGGSSLGRARGARHLSRITAKRDFMIFEQRGTTYADPAMQCPEVVEALQKSAREDLGKAAVTTAELNAVGECRKRLVIEGVDLAAYDSAASAADLEDLRKVLGIERWNLYGLSYSTRLMLNYIREYPGNVRSVILDSVLPPEVNWDETATDGVMLALDRMFEVCRTSEVCEKKYPDLRSRFFKFVVAKQEAPLRVSADVEGNTYTMTLTGNDIFDYAYELLEDTGALPEIPSNLHAIINGDNGPLAEFVRARITRRGFVWGMRYSVWCREEMPFQSKLRIDMNNDRFGFLRSFRIQGSFPEICRIWDVPPAPKIENEPVSSDVPALIFGGEFDPDTPPKWGRQVADRFPNSYFFEVKGVSHGVLFADQCAWSTMMPAFLDDPSKKPDSSCLPQAPSIEFK